MSMRLKGLIAQIGAMLIAGAVVVLAPTANATVILVFGQSVGTNTVTGTAIVTDCTAAGPTCETTLSIVDAPVAISFIDSGGTPAAFLDLTATSSDFDALSGTTLNQHYSGTFSICSTAIGCAINYLSGTFIDLVSGTLGTGGLTLSAGTPPLPNVTFTSDTIVPGHLAPDLALAFSFSNVTPAVSSCGDGVHTGQTLCSFTSSVAGNMSANIGLRVPEPGTLLLLAIGMLGAGWVGSRRGKRA